MTILSNFFTQTHAQEKRDFPLYTRSELGNQIWECPGGKGHDCVFLGAWQAYGQDVWMLGESRHLFIFILKNHPPSPF